MEKKGYFFSSYYTRTFVSKFYFVLIYSSLAAKSLVLANDMGISSVSHVEMQLILIKICFCPFVSPQLLQHQSYYQNI